MLAASINADAIKRSHTKLRREKHTVGREFIPTPTITAKAAFHACVMN
jgi:hypothetical protein